MIRSDRLLLWAPLALLMLGTPVRTLALEPVITEVTIGSFLLRTSLAASKRTERVAGEFRYRAELVNQGGVDAVGVVVDVSSSHAATLVRDGLLIFGNVPAGATVASRDSFSLAHDRSVPFAPAALSYALRQDAIPDIPDWAGTIGPAGGRTDAQQGGVVLDFPPGAVPADTPIRVSRLTSGFDSAEVLASTAHDFGPDGIAFAQPVLLTLTYDPAEIPADVSATEVLSLAKFVGDELVPVPGSIVDPVARTVSAPVSGFSAFVAAYPRPPQPPPPPPGPDPGGDLDVTFGVDGKATFALGPSLVSQVNAVALEPFGSPQRILLAAKKPSIAAIRVLADGQGLDPSFGASGIATRTVQAASAGQAVAVQPDGRILVAGSSNETPPETGLDLVILRFQPDGSPDTGFADDGILIEHRGAATARRIRLLPDGRIVVVAPLGLHQYTAQGAPDPSFGVDGIWNPGQNVRDGLRRASGWWSVLLASSPGNVQMRRLSAAGSQTASNSIQRGEFSQMPSPMAMAETPSGNSYVVGGTIGTSFPFRDLFAARFASSDLDRSPGFGVDGFLERDFGDDEVIRAIAIQDDGRILLVGSSQEPGPEGDSDFLVVRLRSDGFLDTLFGDGGRVLVDFGGDDVATDVVLDGQGRILVVGEARQGGNTSAALVRLLP